MRRILLIRGFEGLIHVCYASGRVVSVPAASVLTERGADWMDRFPS